jgi:hypothetical protein
MRALERGRLATSGNFAELCLADGWLLGDHRREVMEPNLDASTAGNSVDILSSLSVGPRSCWSVGTHLPSYTRFRVNQWTVLPAQLCVQLFAHSEALWPSRWRTYWSAGKSAASATRSRARACVAACRQGCTCRSSRFARGTANLRSTSRPARTAMNLPEYLPDSLPDPLPDVPPDTKPKHLCNKLSDTLSVSLPDLRHVAMWKSPCVTTSSTQPKQMWSAQSGKPATVKFSVYRTRHAMRVGGAPPAACRSVSRKHVWTLRRITALLFAPRTMRKLPQIDSRAACRGALCTWRLTVYAVPQYVSLASVPPIVRRGVGYANRPCNFRACRCTSSRAPSPKASFRRLRKQVHIAT